MIFAGPCPPVGSTVCNHSSAPVNRRASTHFQHSDKNSKYLGIGEKFNIYGEMGESGHFVPRGKMGNWTIPDLTSEEPSDHQTDPFNIKTSGKPK